MIITKTPFRISLFGGGSDLRAFYQHSPGAVLSFSVNQYMYLSSHRFFDHDQIRVKYSRTETVKRAQDLEHPILREVFLKFGLESGIEVSSIADIPAGTGMGSSSSFTVGLLQNLYARRNKTLSPKALAQEACEIEIDRLGEPIGKQDQYIAAFGGIRFFEFFKDESVQVEELKLSFESQKKLKENLLLFYSGRTRAAGSVLKDQTGRLQKGDTFGAVKAMVGLAHEAKKFLLEERLDDLGALLDEGWKLKRSFSDKVSDPELDEIYECARRAGVLGGKILGAGGGGFFLFYCPQKDQRRLRDTLSSLREMEYQIEPQGSSVIYTDE